jgi:hypothetical protein
MTDPMAALRARVSNPHGDDDRHDEDEHGMPVVALVLVAVTLGFGAYGIVQAIREHRTPPELRGDWWARFEREFRAYAARPSRPPRDRRRQRGETA